MNFRIFVEKKPEFNLESQKIKNEISQIVKITQLKIYNIYDVFNIDEADFKKVLFSVFADPVTDIVHHNNPLKSSGFAIEFLPGQYDQRADSAEQCVKLLTQSSDTKIRCGKLIQINEISHTDLELIKNQWINKVESRVKDLDLLEIPTESEPNEIIIFEGFIDFNEEKLNNFHKKQAFSFDLEDLQYIQNYFKKQNRNPTETELKVLDTYWSDHCRHTTFETELNKIQFEGIFKFELETVFNNYLQKRIELNRNEKPITLMDLATISTRYLSKIGKLDNLIISDEINACTIEIEVDFDGKKEDWYLLFKNETHNHPTEIEPFGGASTCLGGAIRDPLSGRSFVYQAMRLSGAANVLEDRKLTIEGKLPQSIISKQAANGFSSYGNQIGLATTLVNEIYHEGYKAKRMEVGFVVGAVPKKWVKREKPMPGDAIILLGGATGRDGVGGAIGSSKEQDETSIHTLSTEVQKGNAVEERKIQRLFRNPKLTKLIKKSNDFGAGGVSVAIGEIADSLEINLDVLPLKYEGLNATEIAISESQERMAVVVADDDKAEFIKLCELENIVALQVAKVTNSGKMQMFWKGKKVVDLDRDFLDTSGSPKKQEVIVNHLGEFLQEKTEFNKINFITALKDKNVASQKGLIEMFDSTVGASSVLMPLGGKNQLTPTEGSIHTLPVLGAKNIETTSVAAWGFDAELSSQNSFLGASFAVVESVAKMVALGVDYTKIRLSFQEYFEKMGQNAHKWGKPLASLLGAYQAQTEFGLAAIGGKDSMSGSFQDLNVPPTLISFACADSKKTLATSPEFKLTDSKLYIVKHNLLPNGMPNYTQLKDNFEAIHKLIQTKKIISVKTIKEGGIAVALAKMSFGNGIGAEVCLPSELLLLKNIGSFVVELVEEVNLPNFLKIGNTIKENVLNINSEVFEIEELCQAWTSTFEQLFPTKTNEKTGSYFSPKSNKFIVAKNPIKIEKPKVFVPIFPGTNSEYDTINSFENEGALVTSIPLININAKTLESSINKWVEAIFDANIIAFSGGFSAGDEPDGSAKYIVNVLKNKKIKTAIHQFLEKGGLLLGICNGFQALIKSGLLPYGKINDANSDSATLTFNKIGRHISQMVHVRVLECNSPWLKGNAGQVFSIPISHGEGRIYANETEIAKLFENQQVGTQYVDLDGKPSQLQDFNPNASMYAIESLCSPCGRIYGRMGHPERFREGLMQNIPTASYHNIFQNAVAYFTWE